MKSDEFSVSLLEDASTSTVSDGRLAPPSVVVKSPVLSSTQMMSRSTRPQAGSRLNLSAGGYGGGPGVAPDPDRAGAGGHGGLCAAPAGVWMLVVCGEAGFSWNLGATGAADTAAVLTPSSALAPAEVLRETRFIGGAGGWRTVKAPAAVTTLMGGRGGSLGQVTTMGSFLEAAGMILKVHVPFWARKPEAGRSGAERGATEKDWRPDREEKEGEGPVEVVTVVRGRVWFPTTAATAGSRGAAGRTEGEGAPGGGGDRKRGEESVTGLQRIMSVLQQYSVRVVTAPQCTNTLMQVKVLH